MDFGQQYLTDGLLCCWANFPAPGAEVSRVVAFGFEPFFVLARQVGGVGLVVVASSRREPGMGGHAVGADEDLDGVAAVHDLSLKPI